MSDPKWRRRREARPAEIVAAALRIFATKGYAAARMEDIAREAGVSKGAIYIYFDTKEAVFRAVVEQAVAPNIEGVRALAAAHSGPVADLVRAALPELAARATALPLGAVAKMVIGESRNFPELAKVWHDQVVQAGVAIISEVIARGQERGEIRPGNPRVHAFSLIGPLLLGVIWRETFTPIGAPDVDLVAVARQHAETVLGGLVVAGEPR